MHNTRKHSGPRMKGRVTRKKDQFSSNRTSPSHHTAFRNQKETSDHDILHLYGALGNDEQTNRDFEEIRAEAETDYLKWKQSEGKW